MDHDTELADRLERAATLLERTLTWLEEHALTAEVERIAATVDPAAARESELAEKLAAAELEIAELRAAAQAATPTNETASLPHASTALQLASPQALQSPGLMQSIRKTVPASTADMLSKHGIGDTPVDVRTLDAALSGLSLEQRIAVKSQLLRAGALV